MIVVKDAPELRGDGGTRRHPFECLAFVCDSRQTARRLTFALANAFQVGFVSSSGWYLSDETKIYQGWFYFGASSMFWFAFKFAGFLEDDKVEPEEEADEVRDRPSQPGGNWAGP